MLNLFVEVFIPKIRMKKKHFSWPTRREKTKFGITNTVYDLMSTSLCAGWHFRFGGTYLDLHFHLQSLLNPKDWLPPTVVMMCTRLLRSDNSPRPRLKPEEM